MLPNLEDLAPTLAGATMSTSLDTAGGYYQIPLDKESSKIPTFMTPCGRFRFKRIPMASSQHQMCFKSKWNSYCQVNKVAS